MNIQTAIENLSFELDFKPSAGSKSHREATKLAVYALKRIRDARFHGYAASAEFMPGETHVPFNPRDYSPPVSGGN